MRILKWRDMAERSTLSMSSLKRLAKADPKFPRKIYLSSFRVGFEESEFNDWLFSKREETAAE